MTDLAMRGPLGPESPKPKKDPASLPASAGAVLHLRRLRRGAGDADRRTTRICGRHRNASARTARQSPVPRPPTSEGLEGHPPSVSGGSRPTATTVTGSPRHKDSRG